MTVVPLWVMVYGSQAQEHRFAESEETGARHGLITSDKRERNLNGPDLSANVETRQASRQRPTPKDDRIRVESFH